LLHYKQIDLNFLHISCSSQSESQKPIGCRNPNVLDLIWLMNSTALDCSKCSGSGQKDKSKLTHTDTHTHKVLAPCFAWQEQSTLPYWCQYVSVWQLRSIQPSIHSVSAQNETTGQYPQTNQPWTNNHWTTHTHTHQKGR